MFAKPKQEEIGKQKWKKVNEIQKSRIQEFEIYNPQVRPFINCISERQITCVPSYLYHVKSRSVVIYCAILVSNQVILEKKISL